MESGWQSISDFTVHQLRQRPAGTVVFKIREEQFNNPVHGMGQGGVPGHMGGHDQPGTGPERRIRRNGFLLKHIQPGIQPPAAQFRFKRLLIDHGAAADIDDNRVVREALQLLFRNDPESVPRSRKRDDQDIRRCRPHPARKDRRDSGPCD